MEKKARDLEATVTTQKEQLTRYERRLKDVVTAYKGLLKEKEALEASLAAFTKPKEGTNEEVTVEKMTEATNEKANNNDTASINSDTAQAESPAPPSLHGSDMDLDAKSHLHTQIITLMNSLATLSAEKSRMEASFQADKRQLRSQIAQKEQNIKELQLKIKENTERAKSDVVEVKAKWIIERQEREKETNNQMVMIRELQKLYADERHLKENIEMQLNNFKTKFASNEAENTRLNELQAQLKEAKMQLKQFSANNKRDGQQSAEAADSLALLQQVQQEMQQLKDQHAVAIKSEQRRVLLAEEQSRSQAALHEDRVANLEARLAELSNTVGNYDRLRQVDQESIQTLKQQLLDLENNTCAKQQVTNPTTVPNATAIRKLSTHNVGELVDEIIRLKQMLMQENATAVNPIDLNKLFAVSADHVHCQQELQIVQQQLEKSKTEIVALQQQIATQRTHITTLQDKVKVLNRNIDEAEQELKQQGEKLRQALKEERIKWQDTLAEQENESRCRVNELEQQLQKQRQRSLQLLDEKEQEIKTLQTSFEVFHNTSLISPNTLAHSSSQNDTYAVSSDAESVEGGLGSSGGAGKSATANAENNSKQYKLGVRSKKMSLGENCHMLHYANELARKDIEIATLRKARSLAESSLRKSIHEKVTAQEELNNNIENLEEQVDRLQRCQTREGANLEYLKNVIISFIVTKDPEDKRHMLNAISAVLQFTDAEIHTINATYGTKK